MGLGYSPLATPAGCEPEPLTFYEVRAYVFLRHATLIAAGSTFTSLRHLTSRTSGRNRTLMSGFGDHRTAIVLR